VVPWLEKLQKEGDSGRKKINEYTRYATVGLCIIQGVFWVNYMISSGYVYSDFTESIWFVIMAVMGAHHGHGLPDVAGRANRRVRHRQRHQPHHHGWYRGPHAQRGYRDLPSAISVSVRGDQGAMTPLKIVFILVAFIGVIAGRS